MIDQKLEAKCPYCTDGCKKCIDGNIEVTVPHGKLYTIKCNDCGHENGGYIVYGTMKRKSNGEPLEDSRACIECNGITHWLLVGDI